jgi:hypothetical protein
MLGDCYAAAIVEHLSKEQLMTASAAIYEVRTQMNFQKVVSYVPRNLLQTMSFIIVSVALKTVITRQYS